MQPPSHGLADFLLPLALMTVTWFWTLLIPIRALVAVVAKVMVAAMIINTFISIYQLITHNATAISLLPRFWTETASAVGAPEASAVLAAEHVRFTGIFNQPAEAGIAYGIALFCLIYLGQIKIGYSRKKLGLCAVELCICC